MSCRRASAHEDTMKPDTPSPAVEEPQTERPASEPEPAAERKPFTPPRLGRHERLPEVTTGFIGTFGP